MKKFRNISVVKGRNTWVVEIRRKWVVKDWKKLGCKSLELGTFSDLKDFVTVGCSLVVKG